MMYNRAVFLDRDGVLNKSIIKEGKHYPPSSLQELIICDGVGRALQDLREAGFILLVVTNQPDVARGTTSRTTVESINNYLARELSLNKFYVCFHDDPDKCDCRKPLPGMLLQGAKDFQLNLSDSFMIGDRWKDIEAGKSAGCKTIWIDTANNEPQTVAPDFVADSLSSAAKWILNY